MNISKNEFDKYIKECRHYKLFNALGWDKGKGTLPSIEIDSEIFQPKIIAEMRGFQIISCAADIIPPLATRMKIANSLKKLVQRNIIIFTNKSKYEQVWLYLYTHNNRPKKVDVRYVNGQDTERIYQRASGLIFELDEHDAITIVDVSKRVSENFAQNAEKVTKRFYDDFKKQHTALLKFIKGIENKQDKDWYASIMLNRLMFCYFMQRRRFLNNDRDYLRNKLNESKTRLGKGKFYSFYRNFLLTLFQRGFGRYEHSPEIKDMIGRIPYLNGGLFDIHEIEWKNPNIDIPDKAFEDIFNLFDRYEWHLDSRDCASGNEISPDVLGYIFEKYINDRAKMGAYYTQEDITDYISRNSILPYLLESVKHACPEEFERAGAVWTMLKNSGDEYIFDSVKKGVTLELPENIAVGLDTEASNLLKRRKDWNLTAPEEYALPTEIWREVVERKKRYEDVSALIKEGKLIKINDFITYNLDIKSFVVDLLERIENPKFIQEFYKILQKITILDPTCGSGAFLFAAMNILEPLYDSCLNRMADYISHDYKGSLDRDIKKIFEKELNLMNNEVHPSKQYFIYKTIILNNLYGVDIMREAVETAKLRLFLKLVSTADPDYQHDNMGIEPLPDIDFNIKAGNTLIGITNKAEMKCTMLGNMFGASFENKVKEDMKEVAIALDEYKKLQLREDSYKSDTFDGAKKKLIDKQAKLKKTLDDLLKESQYPGIKISEEKWQMGYMPFHWLAEFYSIVEGNGGFDVVIGNPPYVEYSDVKDDYQIRGYDTVKAGNLYAFVLERSKTLIHNKGFSGMIVPHSAFCTERMTSVVKLFEESINWISSYDVRPAKLFLGVEQRLAIFITSTADNYQCFSSKYIRWNESYRKYLFEQIVYFDNCEIDYHGIIVKNQSPIFNDIYKKIKLSSEQKAFDSDGDFMLYYHNAPRYWIRATKFMPYFKNDKHGETISSQIKSVCFKDNLHYNFYLSLMNSSLFYTWFIAFSDSRHLNNREIYSYPICLKKISPKLVDLVDLLMLDYTTNKSRKNTFYKTTGNVVYDEYYPKKSKGIIDKIDIELAKLYGFTQEELDYIINYDIKYRMGIGSIDDSSGE
jgi:hypothetical protein